MQTIQKNYVYRALTPNQAAVETKRLMKMLHFGGTTMRDAILGLIVLANTGFMSAVNAMEDVIHSGLGNVVEEMLEIAI